MKWCFLPAGILAWLLAASVVLGQEPSTPSAGETAVPYYYQAAEILYSSPASPAAANNEANEVNASTWVSILVKDCLKMWAILWDLGNYQEAATLAEEACRLDPTNLTAQHALALSQIVTSPAFAPMVSGSTSTQGVCGSTSFAVACACPKDTGEETCNDTVSAKTCPGCVKGKGCCTAVKCGCAKSACCKKCTCTKGSCACANKACCEKCSCAKKTTTTCGCCKGFCCCKGQCACAKKTCACGTSCACAKGTCACGINCTCGEAAAHCPFLRMVMGQLPHPPMPWEMPAMVQAPMHPMILPPGHPPVVEVGHPGLPCPGMLCPMMHPAPEMAWIHPVLTPPVAQAHPAWNMIPCARPHLPAGPDQVSASEEEMIPHPPAGSPRPSSPMHIKAVGKRVHITSTRFEACCERLTYLDGSDRILLEGNVRLTVLGSKKPSKIRAERLTVNRDGSFQINPDSEQQGNQESVFRILQPSTYVPR